jgi:hypothetical protein
MMPRDAMVEAAPIMLAFDFYDGVIEGLSRNILCHDEAYFSMLAWDDAQDTRVFAVVPVECGTFDRLFALFAAFEAPPQRETWMPHPWPIPELDTIIAAARARIPEEAMLVQAMHITDRPTAKRKVEATDRVRIGRILSTRSFDTLREWF